MAEKRTTVIRCKVEYKARISKAKKEAVILARTEVEAKRGLTTRETSPIIQRVYPLGEVTLPQNLILHYVEKRLISSDGEGGEVCFIVLTFRQGTKKPK